MGVCHDALGVSLSKTVPGANLGGSSKYLNESFEDRSGKGFQVNSSFPCCSLFFSPIEFRVVRGPAEACVALYL